MATNDDGGPENPSDKELLDWLQSVATGYGAGWVCRPSSTGRGWRLHETSSKDAGEVVSRDIREAIVGAMLAERAKGEE